MKDLVKDTLHTELEAILPKITQTILDQVKLDEVRILKCINNPKKSHDRKEPVESDSEHSKSKDFSDKEDKENKDDSAPITQEDNKESEIVANN
eukprot:4467776-Ditylum_brightwellii.AAC.1